MLFNICSDFCFINNTQSSDFFSLVRRKIFFACANVSPSRTQKHYRSPLQLIDVISTIFSFRALCLNILRFFAIPFACDLMENQKARIVSVIKVKFFITNKQMANGGAKCIRGTWSCHWKTFRLVPFIGERFLALLAKRSEEQSIRRNCNMSRRRRRWRE